MNVSFVRDLAEDVLQKYNLVRFTPLVSQPKDLAHPLRFQFTLSLSDSIKPNLFLNFIETTVEFRPDACGRKIEAGIQAFLASNKDVDWDISS